MLFVLLVLLLLLALRTIMHFNPVMSIANVAGLQAPHIAAGFGQLAVLVQY